MQTPQLQRTPNPWELKAALLVHKAAPSHVGAADLVADLVGAGAGAGGGEGEGEAVEGAPLSRLQRLQLCCLQ